MAPKENQADSAECTTEKARKHAAVAALGMEALSGIAPQSLFQSASARVIESMHIDYCGVFELDEARPLLLLTAGRGWKADVVGNAVIELEVWTRLLARNDGPTPGIALVGFDELSRKETALLGTHEIQRGVFVTIGDPGHPYGLLGAFSRNDVAFDPDDISFLRSIANTLWSALENHRHRIALKESEERLRFALEAGEMGVWDWDFASNAVIWDAKMYELFGVSPETTDPSAEIIFSLMDAEHRPIVKRALEKTRSEGADFRQEYRVTLPDGSTRWIAGEALPIKDEQGRVTRLTGINFDITERRRHNRELQREVTTRTSVAERQAVQLRVLAAELTQAEQKVRERLAKALHDDLQQIILAAKMKVRRAIQKNDSALVTKRLDEVSDLLTQAVDSTRSYAVELQPPVLQYGGLVDALRWLVRRAKKQHDLEVDLKIQGLVVDVDEGLRLLLFEAMKELILNTVKHAGVSTLYCTLQFEPKGLLLIVEDSGRGFDTEVLYNFSERSPSGIGLLNMRERLKAIGGTLEVESQIGRGSRFRLTLPLTKLKNCEDKVSSPMTAVVRRSQRPAPSGSRISVLIVDDHKLLREGLAAVLYQYPEIEVIDEATDGASAIRLAEEYQPDLVIMDIGLQDINGIEATREIIKRSPETVVIGLSLHKGVELRQAIIDAGAKELIFKDAPPEELIEAISEACSVELKAHPD